MACIYKEDFSSSTISVGFHSTSTNFIAATTRDNSGLRS